MTEIKRLFDFPYYQLEKFNLDKALTTKYNGKWTSISTQEYIDKANTISRALLKLGVEKNDKIAVISTNNRTEWNIMDIGILQVGAQNIPIYPTISADDYEYVLNHSESIYCFVSDEEVLQKVLKIKDKTKLKEVYSFDHIKGCKHYSELFELGKDESTQGQVEERKNAVKSSDLATIIYTSGTTGKPKGVMLSHNNIVSNVLASEKRIPLGSGNSKALSFLPVCHIFERMILYLYQYNGMEIYFAESIEKISGNLKEIKPNVMTAVPRLYEKMYDAIYAKGKGLSGIKKMLFYWAINLGLQYEPYGANGWWYEFQLKIARKLIFNKWQEGLGINVPTGKDSLSMKQKYANEEVISPGTVIISAAGNCNDITKVVEPVFQKKAGDIYYINISQDDFKLGGSSFAQIVNKIGSDTPNVKSAAYVKTVFNTIQNLIKDNQIVAGHDVASGGLITTLLELCFADNNIGAELDLSALAEKDSFKILFSENSGIVLQPKDASIERVLANANIEFHNIGKVTESDVLSVINQSEVFTLTVSKLRDTWYKTSYLLDQKQTANNLAEDRFNNYKNQPLQFIFPSHFTGKLPFPLGEGRDGAPKAAILREKGSNSEREMANAMYLAGFDVKDVHMTDLISGRETLEDIQFLGAVGGFSNSDVLGSAKGWAGAIKYNKNANKVINDFFKREDTLSVGICNGAQLWMELDLVNPEHEVHGELVHNDSQKHESSFTSVKIQENNSIMLSTLAGTRLGVWISHGEGKFNLTYTEDKYNIVAKYAYEGYPHNPNGSSFNTAMMCDSTGRHLVTMPHIERSTFQWNWANYPNNRKDEVSPWLEAFVNARLWIDKK